MLATRHYSTDTFYGRILIQNELLEHVDTFPHPAYRRWRVYDGIRYQVKQTAGDRGITAENMEVTAPISTKIRLMKALVWPAATHGCERMNGETL